MSTSPWSTDRNGSAADRPAAAPSRRTCEGEHWSSSAPAGLDRPAAGFAGSSGRWGGSGADTDPLTTVAHCHEGEVQSFHAVARCSSIGECLVEGIFEDAGKVLPPAARPAEIRKRPANCSLTTGSPVAGGAGWRPSGVAGAEARAGAACGARASVPPQRAVSRLGGGQSGNGRARPGLSSSVPGTGPCGVSGGWVCRRRRPRPTPRRRVARHAPLEEAPTGEASAAPHRGGPPTRQWPPAIGQQLAQLPYGVRQDAP
jgi:hypothetical protein